MVEKMLESLDEQSRKIIILKFVRHDTAEEISKEVDLTERTVYRHITKILENLAIFMIQQNWTVSFIKNQIGDEAWLYEIFKQKRREELHNIERGKREL